MKCDIQYYHDKYGKAIVRKYRQRGIQRFGKSFYDKRGQNGSPVPNVNRSGAEPTFWEFVTAILETGERGGPSAVCCVWIISFSSGTMDEHWMPISESCSVCSEDVKYDFVIKFEELEREESYLVRRLGLDTLILPRWENRQSPDNASTSQVQPWGGRGIHMFSSRNVKKDLFLNIYSVVTGSKVL